MDKHNIPFISFFIKKIWINTFNIPFIALADENYKYFSKYSVERSIGKTLLDIRKIKYIDCQKSL